MPEYTAVIPVQDDPEGIATTLESLPLEDDRLNVVVIDNGSADATPTVLAEFAAHPAVTIMHEPRERSSYAARNRAITASDATHYVFIDADMWVSPGWLDQMDRAVTATAARVAAAAVELVMPPVPSLFDRYDHHTGFPIRRYIATKQFAPTCSLIVHQRVFASVGLFDEHLHSGGDVEFGKRVVAAGFKITYLPEVRTHHPTRSTLGAHLRKAIRVGRGHAQMRRRHPSLFGGQHNLPRPGWDNRPSSAVSMPLRALFMLLTMVLTLARGIGFVLGWLEGGTARGGGSQQADADPPG